jgi:hypothetical protein
MTMGRSVAIGATGYTLASLAGYAIWAFAGRALYRSIGELGLYAVCAIVFILLGSFLLRPTTRMPLAKFSAIFTTAFLAYAIAWCAAWFGAKGRPGEWLGSLAGSFAFCVVLAAWFKAWRALLLSAAVLFVTHSIGYFAGSWSYYALRSENATAAKLAWGFFHGLGMGAGLGFAFYRMQAPSASEMESSTGQQSPSTR